MTSNQEIFIGRQKELEILKQSLENLRNKKSEFIFIDADPGTGKSTLVEEYLASIPTSDYKIIDVECTDRYGENPEGMLKAMYKKFQSGVPQKDWKRKAYRTAIEIGKDIIKDGVPVIGSVVVNTVEAITSKRDVEQSIIQSVSDKLLDKIVEEATKRPLIIFLDDLQWIDSLSANFLFTLAKKIKKEPTKILLIGTYRSHEIQSSRLSSRHPLADKINEIKGLLRTDRNFDSDNFNFIEIHLSDLAASEIPDLIRIKFPNNDFPNDFPIKLFKCTQGNALFIYCLLDLLEKKEAIINNGGSYSLAQESFKEIPITIEGIIQERYESLNDTLKKILVTASISGIQFKLDIIQNLLKLDDIEFIDLIEDLDKKYRLLIQSIEIEKYSFRHALIHKYIYDSMTDQRKRTYHKALAKLILEPYKVIENMPKEILDEYTHHFKISEGFDLGSSLELILTDNHLTAEQVDVYNELIADAYNKWWGFNSKEVDYEILIKKVKPLHKYSELKNHFIFCSGISEILYYGNNEVQFFRITLFPLTELGLKFTLRNYLDILYRVLHPRIKEGHSAEILAIILFNFSEQDQKGLDQESKKSLYNLITWICDNSKALVEDKKIIHKCYHASIELFRKIDDAVYLAKVLNQAADWYFELGLPQGSIVEEYYKELISLYRKLDDRSRLILVLNKLAIISKKSEDFKSAIAYYTDALETYREDKGVIIVDILENLGLVYKKVKEFNKATTCLHRAIELLEISKDEKIILPRTLIGITFNESEWPKIEKIASLQKTLASIYEDMGEMENAILLYENICSTYKGLRDFSEVDYKLQEHYKKRQDYKQLIEHCSSIAEYYKDTDPKQQCYALFALGSSYELLLGYENAISSYEEAFRIAIEHNNLSFYFERATTLSLVFCRIQQHQKAILFLNNCLEALRKEIHKDEMRSKLYSIFESIILINGFAFTYLQVESYEDAIKYYREGIEIRNKLNLQGSLWLNDELLLEAGLKLIANNKFEIGLTFFHEVHTLLKDSQNKNLAFALLGIGMALGKLNKIEDAKSYLLEASNHFLTFGDKKNSDFAKSFLDIF